MLSTYTYIFFFLYFLKPTIVAGIRPTIEPHFIHHCSLCAYVSPKWYAPPNGQTLFGVASIFSFGLVCLTSVLPSFLPHLSDIVRLTNTIDCCPFFVSLRVRSSNEHELNEIEREREKRIQRVIIYASEQMSELFNECALYQLW
jgi:hypothetical protein